MDGADGVVELRSGVSRALIAPAGAEWRAWSVAGAPLLWTPDAAIWSQTSPVLFPVCGWTRGGEVRVGGKTYPLGLHGFAAEMIFEIVARGQDFVRLVLRDSPQTRALYPFSFELEIEYRLTSDSFSALACVRNRGHGPMPYAFGLHPGFRWPFCGGAQSDYSILFDVRERAEVPLIAPGGLFSPETRAIEFAGARLALSPETFAREALCILDARSRGLRFEGPDSCAIRVEMDGFRHIVLWSRPGAPFLCIEAWTGYGDPVGFEGELSEKPSMIILQPGAEQSHRAVFEWRN